MSLTTKEEMTESSVSADCPSDLKTQGPAPAGGKARSAAAKLRHEFYSQTRDEALIALGEDPADYRRLLRSLADDLQPKAGLEGELVLRMARTLWRMRRGERMQDGLAIKRVQSGTDMEELSTGLRFRHIYGIYDRLGALGRDMNRPGFAPSEAYIDDFVNGFGDNPPGGLEELVPLLRSLGKATPKRTGPASESHGTDPMPDDERAQDADQLRDEIEDVLFRVMRPYQSSTSTLSARCQAVRSPENIAAMMVPQDDKAMLMQRMEDSSLRQLWRLTNTLIRVRKGALTQKDVKNEG